MTIIVSFSEIPTTIWQVFYIQFAVSGNGWGTDVQSAEVVTTDPWGGETNDNQWTAETASNDNNDWNANNQGEDQG